jgi:hypothetical protein
MPTTLGIAKFTAADEGLVACDEASGCCDGTVAGGCAAVDCTVDGAEAAVVSVSEELLQPARDPPVSRMAGTATQTHGFFQPDLLWAGFGVGGLSS